MESNRRGPASTAVAPAAETRPPARKGPLGARLGSVCPPFLCSARWCLLVGCLFFQGADGGRGAGEALPPRVVGCRKVPVRVGLCGGD